MKRLLTVSIAAGGLLLGGIGAAHADPPFPGEDGGINEDHPAWYGLCTAYNNNSDNGKQNGAPFQALEEHFDEDGDGSLSDEETEALLSWCADRTPGNSGNSNAPAPGPRGGR